MDTHTHRDDSTPANANTEAYNAADVDQNSASNATTAQPAEDADQPDKNLATDTEQAEEEAPQETESERNTKLQDSIIRLQADMENMRKRHERDLAAAHKFGLEKLMRELLPVLDSFSMGLQTSAENETNNALLEGMTLTQKMLDDALQKYTLTSIDPKGEKFDPEQHEAMTIVPSPDVAENTIIEVIQTGYALSGRLLRPARVIVSGKIG